MLIKQSCKNEIQTISENEQGKAVEKITDNWNHVIFPGELYLKGFYLVKARSKSTRMKQFRQLTQPVYITPDEIFQFSLEIDDQLRMDVSLYGEHLEHTHLEYVYMHSMTEDIAKEYIVVNFFVCLLWVTWSLVISK